MKKKSMRQLAAALPNAGKPLPALRRGPLPPAKPEDISRLLQRFAGEAVIMSSHEGGFLAGMKARVLELNRAHRWKMLARRLRQQLKAARAMNTGLLNGLEQAERAKR